MADTKHFISKDQAKTITHKIKERFEDIESGLTKVSFSETGTSEKKAKYVTVKDESGIHEWKLGGGDGKVKDIKINGVSQLDESGNVNIDLTNNNYAYHFRTSVESGEDNNYIILDIFTHNFNPNIPESERNKLFTSKVIKAGDNIQIEKVGETIILHAVTRGGATKSYVDNAVAKLEDKVDIITVRIERESKERDTAIQKGLGDLNTKLESGLAALDSKKLGLLNKDPEGKDPLFIYDITLENGLDGLNARLKNYNFNTKTYGTKTIDDFIKHATGSNSGLMSPAQVVDLKYAKDGLNEEKTRAIAAEAAEKEARINADSLLDQKLTAEEQARINADSENKSKIEQEIVDRKDKDDKLDKKILVETNRALNVESGLLDALNSEIDRAMTVESGLSQDITEETNRAKQEEYRIEHKLDGELNALKEKDIELEGKIDTEKDRARDAEAALQEAIDDERTRAQGIESGLRTDLTAEKGRAEVAEQSLRTDLNTEISNRKSKDTELDNLIHALINAESGERIRVDAELLAKFAEYLTKNETEARINLKADNFSVDGRTVIWKSGETRVLTANIPDVLTLRGVKDTVSELPGTAVRGDTWLVGTEAVKDYYVNIPTEEAPSTVNWLKVGDTSIDLNLYLLKADADLWYVRKETYESGIATERKERIAGEVVLTQKFDTLSALLADEVAERKTKTKALESGLLEEQRLRSEADTNLQNKIAAETTRATTKETELANNITNEIADRKAADKVLENKIKEESGLRKAGDDALRTRIEAEESGRIAADNQLNTKITDEEARAKVRELELEFKIASEKIARESGDTKINNKLSNEITRATLREDNLESGLNAEKLRREADDAELKTRITKVGNDLASEITERKAATSALETKINQEEVARQQAVQALSNDVNTVKNEIRNEETARKADKKELTDLIGAEVERAKNAESGILGELDDYYKIYDEIRSKEHSTYSAAQIDERIDNAGEKFAVDNRTVKWDYSTESGELGMKTLRAQIPSVMRILDVFEESGELPIIGIDDVEVGDTYVVRSEKALYTAFGHKEGEELVADKWEQTGTTEVDLEKYIKWADADAHFATRKEVNRKQNKLISGVTLKTIGSSLLDQVSLLGSGPLIVTIEGGEIGEAYSTLIAHLVTDENTSLDNVYNVDYTEEFVKADLEKIPAEYIYMTFGCAEGYYVDETCYKTTADPTEYAGEIVDYIEQVSSDTMKMHFNKDTLIAEDIIKGSVTVNAKIDPAFATAPLCIKLADETGKTTIGFKTRTTLLGSNDGFIGFGQLENIQLQYKIESEEEGRSKDWTDWVLHIDEHSGEQYTLNDPILYGTEKLYIRNLSDSLSTISEDNLITSLVLFTDFPIIISGQINALINNNENPEPFTFARLFASGSGEYGIESHIVEANKLILPSNLGARGICYGMFENDLDLVKAPSWSNTTDLGLYGFSRFTSNCSNLERLPIIPSGITYHTDGLESGEKAYYFGGKVNEMGAFNNIRVGFYYLSFEGATEYEMAGDAQGLECMFGNNSGDTGATPLAGMVYFTEGTINKWKKPE